MKKSVTGAGEGSIIRHLFNSHGPTAINIYVHVLQQVVGSWMSINAHTLSLWDICPDEELHYEIEDNKAKRLREVKGIAQKNVSGIFDQTMFLELIRIKLLDLPSHYVRFFSPTDRRTLAEDLSYNLFDVLQIERNRFFRGLSEKHNGLVYDPAMVTASIHRTINKFFRVPDLASTEDMEQGDLIKLVSKNPGTQAYKDEVTMTDQLKRDLFGLVHDITQEFLTHQVKTPFDNSHMQCRTLAEIETVEADVTDATEAIATEGRILLMSKLNKGDFVDMIKSEARGSDQNASQMNVAMGQQTMSNARLKPKVSDGTRVNTLFLMEDPDPEAYGFVRQSLFQGMSATGWFAASMPSRQTQMDTAFKTGDTGYLQKRMMANNGDFVVVEDGSVRDEFGSIISFASGGTFFDPARMTKMGGNYSLCDCSQLYTQLEADQSSTVKTVREAYKNF